MVILRLRRPERADPETIPTPLLDLLNRDQRTTITINRKTRHDVGDSPREDFDLRFDPNPTRSPDVYNSSSYGFNKKIRSRSHRPRRRLACLASRLGEVFIVGVCLLTIVRVPAVMSAPSTRHAKATEQIHSQKPTEDTLSYLHPCGKSYEEMRSTYYKMASRESDPDILKHIIIRTKNALSYAESFRERYVEKTFHLRFEKHHAHWENQNYDWLPNKKNNGIPKSLGEKVSPVHLENYTIDEFLINVYEHLQKFAVGLEQVVVDQKKLQGEFGENFRMMEVHLRNVLCEIREAMMERGVDPRGQVPRSIMKDNIRNLEQASFRNIRDWVIFRDLMNCLEYIIQVFTFIDENLPQSSAAISS